MYRHIFNNHLFFYDSDTIHVYEIKFLTYNIYIYIYTFDFHSCYYGSLPYVYDLSFMYGDVMDVIIMDVYLD